MTWTECDIMIESIHILEEVIALLKSEGEKKYMVNAFTGVITYREEIEKIKETLLEITSAGDIGFRIK